MSTTDQDTQHDEQRDTIVLPSKTVDPTESVLDRLTENTIENILPARYLNRNQDGELVETVPELFERVARNVAEAELEYGGDESDVAEWEREFYELMTEQRLMPNSPCLMNAGTDIQQLSACFVLNPEDSMDDIFDTARKAALIFQSGGGVGYSLSNIRPRGDIVESTGRPASGPLSFAQVYNETCQTVEQGGVRRGAQMAILRVDHADIGRFATAKREEGELENFNISVGVTDEFIEAKENGETYTIYDPKTNYEEPYETPKQTAEFYNAEYVDEPEAIVDENIWRDYDIPAIDHWRGEIELEPGEPMELPAEFIWDLIVDGAWLNGEPGIFYYDETNEQHSFDVDEYPEHEIKATNPCAEQPLAHAEACNLAHINLSLLVDESAAKFDTFVEERGLEDLSVEEQVDEYLTRSIKWNDLDRTVDSGTRFLENVVEQSDFPLEEIENQVDRLRKIGLGIMGTAQMLAQMGVPYGSEESYELAEQLMREINYRSKEASRDLARERGVFGAWEESKYANPTEYPEWFEEHVGQDPEAWEGGFPLRNHNTTTVAPTGTTSLIADTSSGCEPFHNVAYMKNVGDDIQGDDILVEFDDYFRRTLEANGYDADHVAEVAEEQMRNGEFEGVESLPVANELADIFVTSEDLRPEQHSLMQAAFQRGVDSGVSKTVNLPASATRDDVGEAYQTALDLDIKGIALYRDGSREGQVIQTNAEDAEDDEEEEEECIPCQEADDEPVDVAEEDECPDCGGELIQQEGCSKCRSCGFSACSV